MSLTSNTIFALLMAAEQDLRRFCASELHDPPLTDDETRSAQSRLATDRAASAGTSDWQALFDYLDLSQLLDVIARHDRQLAAAVGEREKDVAQLVAEMRRLVQTRNRVCHARPPEAEDLPLTLEVIDKLEPICPGISFQELRDVRTELAADPLYPLTLTIPEFWRTDTLVVDNNLPPSEFDDTGFIGRQRDRTNLLKLLTGPHPLITVTGEGGVGKTALAMRCLYDLLERRDLYDAIVWMSLKTNHLTVSGVRQIVGAMSTEVDILASVAQRFGSAVGGMGVEELFAAVIEVLDNLTVLLVIDNLETIDRNALRPLFMEIPRRSKVLVTSRIGIGEFELRYPLQPLDSGDALRLIRATARILNADSLARRDDGQLHEVAEKLFRNPLAIRWFVQSYSEGRSVRDLLDRKRNLEELLQFCFQNLYTTLDESQVKYLRTLVAIGQPLSEVQLALLAGVTDVERLRASMDYLYASNLIIRAPDPSGRADAVLWTTSDFARQYILSRDTQVATERLRLYPSYRALIQARDNAAQEGGGNPFRSRVIHCSSTDEATVVRTLTDALMASSRGEHKAALGLVEIAQRLLPDFYEVWRVSAQVRDAAGDILGAMGDFERAYDLSDGRVDRDPLLVFYAQFLSKQEQFASAVEVVRSAAQRPDAPIELVATYGWMLTLAGSAREGAAAFEDVHEELFLLSGPGRSAYLTQYAESLRRAGEIEERRALHKEAFQYVLRSLAVVAEACRQGWRDPFVVRQGQRSVREALFILARRCDLEDWRQLAALCADLAKEFDLIGDDQRPIENFVDRWPLVARREDFAELFPGFARKASSDQVPLLEGTLKPILFGREYGFIVGDDGQDYWIHRGQVRSALSWEQIRRLPAPRVRFASAPAPEPGQSPRALSMSLLSNDADSA